MSDVAWVVPEPIEGSGGHRTIYKHASALERAGHRCWIYVEGSGNGEKEARRIERFFGFRFERVHAGWNDIRRCDVAIATVWYSAAVVSAIPSSCANMYFVQDYEACFNPMGDGYIMAENSYRYGLIPVTIGRWLGYKLKHLYDSPSWHIDFCADEKIYKKTSGIDREKSVCFIYQPEKPRRCARLGLEALGIVKHLVPDATIYLYGSPKSEAGNIWFPHEHLGLLDVEACNALYNRCAVGLCLSSSNPSRIPFEMMASGLPVVDLRRENNVFDLPPGAVMLSDSTPEALAENLVSVLKEETLYEDMSRAAVAFMASRTASWESDMFVEAVERIFNGESPAGADVLPIRKFHHVHEKFADAHDADPESRPASRAPARKLPFLKNTARYVMRRTRRYWE